MRLFITLHLFDCTFTMVSLASASYVCYRGTLGKCNMHTFNMVRLAIAQYVRLQWFAWQMPHGYTWQMPCVRLASASYLSYHGAPYKCFMRRFTSEPPKCFVRTFSKWQISPKMPVANVNYGTSGKRFVHSFSDGTTPRCFVRTFTVAPDKCFLSTFINREA